MVADGGKSGQAGRGGSGSGGDSVKPTEVLSAAFVSAAAAFRKSDTGDQEVMIAFGLGWQMAEVYRPDRRGGSRPADQDDLPGISRLGSVELQEMVAA